jgi:SAM-dependent methyltransferase
MAESRGGPEGWAAAMPPTEVERERLRAMAGMLDPATIGHLGELGAGEGWRCLEVGAGEGSIARWLSARVGSGSVVATDLDTRFFGFPVTGEVEVLRHDISADPCPGEPFDLIHARFVLMHIPSRERVLRKLASWLKPEGWLLIEDGFMLPELAGDPLVAKFYAAVARQFAGQLGSDFRWALTLPAPLRALGLRRTGGAAHIPADAPAGADRTSVIPDAVTVRIATLEQMRTGLIEAGLLTEQDTSQLTATLADPDLVLYCAGWISAWGQRPPG